MAKKKENKENFSSIKQAFLKDFKDRDWSLDEISSYEIFTELNAKTLLAYLQLTSGMKVEYYDMHFVKVDDKFILYSDLIEWMSINNIFPDAAFDDDSLYDEDDIDTFITDKKKAHTA